MKASGVDNKDRLLGSGSGTKEGQAQKKLTSHLFWTFLGTLIVSGKSH